MLRCRWVSVQQVAGDENACAYESTGTSPLRSLSSHSLLDWSLFVILIILFSHTLTHGHSMCLSTVSSDRRLSVYRVSRGNSGSRLVRRFKPVQVCPCPVVMDLCCTCCSGSQSKRRGKLSGSWCRLLENRRGMQGISSCLPRGYLFFHQLCDVIISVGLVVNNCAQSQTCTMLTPNSSTFRIPIVIVASKNVLLYKQELTTLSAEVEFLTYFL